MIFSTHKDNQETLGRDLAESNPAAGSETKQWMWEVCTVENQDNALRKIRKQALILQTVVFWVLQCPSDSSAFLANRLPFPHWIGLALRSATVKVFQGERLMSKNNHLPLGDGSNMVNSFFQGAHEFAAEI